MTELADPDDWPTPADAAERFVSSLAEESSGVTRDTLIDECIRADDACYRMRATINNLDAIVDDGAFNARTLDEVTKLHRQTVALREWIREYEQLLAEELEDDTDN